VLAINSFKRKHNSTLINDPLSYVKKEMMRVKKLVILSKKMSKLLTIEKSQITIAYQHNNLFTINEIY